MARASVHLPDALRRLFPGAPARLAVEAETVGDALAALDRAFPGIGDRLCAPGPRLRRQINLFVATRRVGLGDALHDGDELVVLLAVTG